MSDLFNKLNLKDEQEIFILNAPASFAGEIDALHDVAIKRTIDASSVIQFSLAFADIVDQEGLPDYFGDRLPRIEG